MKLYERDVPLVQIGQPVDVNVEALPGEVFKGTVTFEAFQLDPQTRTLDARVEVKNPDMRLRPGMFADATIAVPVGAAPPPTSRRRMCATPQNAKAYLAALQPYLEAQGQLAEDTAERVARAAARNRSEPDGPDGDPRVKRLAAAAHAAEGQDLKALREAFKEVSAAMIEMGKETGLPPDAAAVQVFRCPMAKADWLQPPGETANPYYGSEMLTCGSAVESLPKAEAVIAATGHATRHRHRPCWRSRVRR